MIITTCLFRHTNLLESLKNIAILSYENMFKTKTTYIYSRSSLQNSDLGNFAFAAVTVAPTCSCSRATRICARTSV